MGVAHGASDAVHLLPPHVYLQLLLGWGEHGLPGAVCATVALSHIAAAAAILGLAKFSHDSAVFLGVPGKDGKASKT